MTGAIKGGLIFVGGIISGAAATNVPRIVKVVKSGYAKVKPAPKVTK